MDSLFATVKKLHYFKVSFADELAQLICSISTTEDDFVRTWNTLVERYDYKRTLINSYLGRLFGLKVSTKKSAVDLRTLVNDTCEIIRASGSMDRPIDPWDDLLVYMRVQRLDRSTRRA